jgi:hypothetical protein
VLDVAMNIGVFTVSLLAGLTALVTPALAEVRLVSSSPADKTSVDASPAELDLSFSDALNSTASGLTIVGADMAPIATEDPMLMDGDKMLMVPVSQTLPAGTYVVRWHVLSTDGQQTSGNYSFTVTP